jgi:hypothetical protein
LPFSLPPTETVNPNTKLDSGPAANILTKASA